MKKSCKIFSAVALSAVLAMGTAMPAFANVVDDFEGDDLKNGDYVNADGNLNGDYWKSYDKNALENGASTNVNIATYSSNYSVTVPLFAPFMLDTAGGTGIAPTNYGIINGGEAAVFVTNVKWEMTETADWTFADGSAADGSGLGSDANPLPVVQKKGGAASTTTLPTYGSFAITLTPDNTDADAGIGEAINTFVPAPTGTSNNLATAEKSVKWVIVPDDVKTAKDDESFNVINLGIMGSKLFKSLEAIQPNVAAITYTVDSRAPEAPATPQS